MHHCTIAPLQAFFGTLKRKQLLTNPVWGGIVYTTGVGTGLALRGVIMARHVRWWDVVAMLACIAMRFSFPRTKSLAGNVAAKVVPAALFWFSTAAAARAFA